MLSTEIKRKVVEAWMKEREYCYFGSGNHEKMEDFAERFYKAVTLPYKIKQEYIRKTVTSSTSQNLQFLLQLQPISFRPARLEGSLEVSLILPLQDIFSEKMSALLQELNKEFFPEPLTKEDLQYAKTYIAQVEMTTNEKEAKEFDDFYDSILSPDIKKRMRRGHLHQNKAYKKFYNEIYSNAVKCMLYGFANSALRSYLLFLELFRTLPEKTNISSVRLGPYNTKGEKLEELYCVVVGDWPKAGSMLLCPWLPSKNIFYWEGSIPKLIKEMGIFPNHVIIHEERSKFEPIFSTQDFLGKDYEETLQHITKNHNEILKKRDFKQQAIFKLFIEFLKHTANLNEKDRQAFNRELADLEKGVAKNYFYGRETFPFFPQQPSSVTQSSIDSKAPVVDPPNNPMGSIRTITLENQKYQVNLDYEYEDNDIQAILNARLTLLHHTIRKMPVHLLAASDLIVPGQVSQRLQVEKDQHSGQCMAMIPLNLGNYHWAALLFEFNPDKSLKRAEFIDSRPGEGHLPAGLNAQLQVVYPRHSFVERHDRIIQEDGDGTSCGPCVIANLIYAATRPDPAQPPVLPEGIAEIRANQLLLVRMQRLDFYDGPHGFYQRQLENRPTFDARQTYPWLKAQKTNTEVTEINRLVQIVKVLPVEIKEPIEACFRLSEAVDETTASQVRLAQIRSAFWQHKENVNVKQLILSFFGTTALASVDQDSFIQCQFIVDPIFKTVV